MTSRCEARLAGYTYLAYIAIALSASMLAAKTTAGADIAHKLVTLRSTIAIARITVLLDLLQVLCAVLLAITLYRLSKAVDATLALCFRLGEGLLGFLPVMGKLELMRLATDMQTACTQSPACLAIASEILHRPDDVFSEFCFVVGGFLLPGCS